ncbi:MAG: PAS domain S-box protein, partial [Chloroflexi bacterium]|nr:PAS domain S-box protein [Chloroflexota bacterium]
MSQARAEATEPRFSFKPRLASWLEGVGNYLSVPRSTLKNRHFWIIIGLVLLVAAAHSSVEVGTLFPSAWRLLYFVPTTVFLVPVVYAALTFGLKGALATALFATVTAIPNWVLYHDGWGRFGCMFQVFIVDVTAFFVGHQVERRKEAWQQAEVAATAKKASELKYRNLLQSSPIAILVVNAAGSVVEANEAARILFGKNTASLEGIHLADLVGKRDAQRLLRASQDGGKPDPLTLRLKDGPRLHIEPRVSKAELGEGQSVTQIVLRDATEEQRRRAGLKAYTAYVIKALEEERSRI